MNATAPGSATPADTAAQPRDPQLDLDLDGSAPAPAEKPAAPESNWWDDVSEPAPAAEPEPEPADEPKQPGRGRRLAAALRAAIAQSKLFTRQPISLAEAWQRSGVVEPRRSPDDSDFWKLMWLISNRFDRVLWFGIYFLAPTFLAGGVLWVAERPTRRWGTVIVLVFVLAAIPAMLA